MMTSTTHRTPTLYRHKLFWGLMLSILIGLAGCADESTTDTDIQKHLDRGQSYIDQGQYKAAIIEARNAAQKAPEDEAGHLLLSKIYLDLGQVGSALTALSEIENQESVQYLFLTAQAFNKKGKYRSTSSLLNSNKPKLSSADETQFLRLMGESETGLKNYEAANKLYQQWANREPQNIEPLLGLASVSALQGNLDQATKQVSQALDIDESNIKALVLQANIKYKQGDLTAAEDALTNALTAAPTTDMVTPQRVTILSQLANILTRQGRSTEALIYTRILNEAVPGRAALKAKFEEAITLFQNSELEKAERLLEEVLSESPNHELAKQILGTIKYNKGDLRAAEQYFTDNFDAETAPDGATLAFALTNIQLNQSDKVLELLGEKVKDSNNPNILGLYGMAAISSNQFNEGEIALKKALALAPEQSRLRLALADFYNRQSKTDDALQQLQLGYKNTPDDPYIQKALLRQYLSLQQPKKAKQLVKEIASKFGNNSDTMTLVGGFQYYSGNNDSAQASLKKALSLDPSNLQALRVMGGILLRLNKGDAAEDHFRKVINQKPDLALGYKGLISSSELKENAQQAIEEIEKMAQSSASPAAFATLVEYYARNREFERANQALTSGEQTLDDPSALKQVAVKLALSEGSYAIRNNNLNQARVSLMRGLKNAAENSQLQTLLIQVEIADKNYMEANKLIDQLASTEGNLTMLLRGDLAAAQDKLTIALNHYTTLWENAPSDNLARRIYQTYRRNDDNETSASFISDWAKVFPKSLTLLTIRSGMALADSRYEDAIVDLKTALEIQQTRPSPILLNNLAWAYQQNGQLNEALATATQAYQIAPKSPEIADTYGWVLFQTGDTAKAKKVLTTAQSLAPNNKEIEEHLRQVNQ